MSHTSIIDSWPTLNDFARDIGVAYGTAKAMRRRGSIPPGYWTVLVNHARRRRLKGITFATLAEVKAREPESERASA